MVEELESDDEETEEERRRRLEEEAKKDTPAVKEIKEHMKSYTKKLEHYRKDILESQVRKHLYSSMYFLVHIL